mgnify:CR=1 FL=1
MISVIGDGSLTGGMAYEALNNAASLHTNFIIVLNDNHMSISENVGGMSRYLANLRTADIYTGLKKGVTNALQQVPVMGDRMIEHIRKTKSSIKQLVVPGMFLRIWELLIWDRFRDTIYQCSAKLLRKRRSGRSGTPSCYDNKRKGL